MDYVLEKLWPGGSTDSFVCVPEEVFYARAGESCVVPHVVDDGAAFLNEVEASYVDPLRPWLQRTDRIHPRGIRIRQRPSVWVADIRTADRRADVLQYVRDNGPLEVKGHFGTADEFTLNLPNGFVVAKGKLCYDERAWRRYQAASRSRLVKIRDVYDAAWYVLHVGLPEDNDLRKFRRWFDLYGPRRRYDPSAQAFVDVWNVVRKFCPVSQLRSIPHVKALRKNWLRNEVRNVAKHTDEHSAVGFYKALFPGRPVPGAAPAIVPAAQQGE